MKFKTFLTKLLFSKKQRNTIWRALVYSEYKYRQHGNVDAAVAVQLVINEVEVKLGIVPQKFTKSEVDRIVNNVISDSKKNQESLYFAGVRNGKRQAYNEFRKFPEVRTSLAVGTIVDPEKCKNCDDKEGCIVGSAVIDAEENNEVEQTTTETTNTTEETSTSNQD